MPEYMEGVGFGRAQVGVPPPSRGAALARLRRDLRRLQVGNNHEELLTPKQVKYIRARLPALSREMAMKFETHWLGPRDPNDPDKPRLFAIWRVE